MYKCQVWMQCLKWCIINIIPKSKKKSYNVDLGFSYIHDYVNEFLNFAKNRMYLLTFTLFIDWSVCIEWISMVHTSFYT